MVGYADLLDDETLKELAIEFIKKEKNEQKSIFEQDTANLLDFLEHHGTVAKAKQAIAAALLQINQEEDSKFKARWMNASGKKSKKYRKSRKGKKYRKSRKGKKYRKSRKGKKYRKSSKKK